MFVVLTVACLFAGYRMNRVLRKRTAVLRFYELTAHRPLDHGDHLTTMGYRHDGKDQYYKPIIPEWLHPLRDVLGEEAFGEVTGVQLQSTQATNDDLRHLAHVPTIERVNLSGTHVTDEGLVHLRACPKLRSLILDKLPITDQGLAEVATHEGLEILSLSGTKATDAGLPQLEKLTRLKQLWLRSTAITNEGYLRLQAALSECEIQADVPAYYQKVQQLYLDCGRRSNDERHRRLQVVARRS